MSLSPDQPAERGPQTLLVETLLFPLRMCHPGKEPHQGTPTLQPPGSLCCGRSVCLSKQIIRDKSSSLSPLSRSDPVYTASLPHSCHWDVKPQARLPQVHGSQHPRAGLRQRLLHARSVSKQGQPLPLPCSDGGENASLRGPEPRCTGCERREERTWGLSTLCPEAWAGSQQVPVALTFKKWAVTFKTGRDLY